MRDLSFFLLKNLLGSKTKKGFKNFCSGDGSTSTLNQQQPGNSSPYMEAQSLVDSPLVEENGGGIGGRGTTAHSGVGGRGTTTQSPTLEEMILQLDLEEKMARRAKLDEYGEIHHRMSCVNSSDILRSARNALNQYPRFSLDGKDSMYRSSFRNVNPRFSAGNDGRRSSVDRRLSGFDSELQKKAGTRCFPGKIGGERVVWCKPGVVAKLMGLEAMPVPVNGKGRLLNSMFRKQNLRRRTERQETERRRYISSHGGGGGKRAAAVVDSCSTAASGYYIVKPVTVDITSEEAGWPMRHFL